MKSFRKIVNSPNDSITVELPPEFRSRRLEVVVTPITDGNLGWPAGFFQRIAGAWSGVPLERAPQGGFETRQSLD
jgi:hypothetical protein